jgi:DNA-binding transcriptional MerR regulator
MEMEEKIAALREWNEKLQDYQTIPTEEMPDIDLYMDQVVTFIGRQLELFFGEGEKPITPSMINNYTKNGIIPRPVSKRYDKAHLAGILMLSVFKQILPLGDIAHYTGTEDEEEIFALYQLFSEMQDEQKEKIAVRMQTLLDESLQDAARTDEQLMHAAMEMMVEANLLSVCAKRILHTLRPKAKKNDKAKKQTPTEES